MLTSMLASTAVSSWTSLIVDGDDDRVPRRPGLVEQGPGADGDLTGGAVYGD